MNSILRNSIRTLFILFLSASFSFAGPTLDGKPGKKKRKKELKHVYTEVHVDVSPEELWDIVRIWGEIADYHGSLLSSHTTNGINEGVGAERFCQITKKLSVVEKVVDWEEGKRVYYEVTEAEGFPAIEGFFVAFGVKSDGNGKSIVYNTTDYRLKSGLMTWMAKGRLKKGNESAVLGIKHFAETGEKRADPKVLRKKYKDQL